MGTFNSVIDLKGINHLLEMYVYIQKNKGRWIQISQSSCWENLFIYFQTKFLIYNVLKSLKYSIQHLVISTKQLLQTNLK